MGAILDSPENIRQGKKSPSRKAHCRKEKLEKDKIKGVNMQSKTHGETEADRLASRILNYLSNPRYGASSMTYVQLEAKLAEIVDRAAKEIGDPEFTEKVKEFKRVAFYEESKRAVTPSRLEEKTSNYLGNIQRIFKNGSH